MAMVLVKFLRCWKMFNGGETAGVDDRVAEELIRNKYAEPFAERAAVAKGSESDQAQVALAPDLASPTKAKKSKKKKAAKLG